jgi:uncharacterized protein
MTWVVDPRFATEQASDGACVERLGETKLATLDHRHFSIVRPAHVKHLQLLPE